jgi:hypothetical protein
MTVQTMLPRGIRNNNPLNIRLNPDNRWQGKVPPKHNSDGAFEQFEDPIMGLRAAAVLLIAHYDRRHLDTIRKLVEVWAPPNENDTEACPPRRRGKRLRHRRAARPTRLRLPAADFGRNDPSRERPPALHRRADRRSTAPRRSRAARALAAADADG